MKVVSAVCKRFSLPFRRPFKTANGIYHERQGFILTLKDEDGFVGYGEVSPLPGYSQESLSGAGLIYSELESELCRTWNTVDVEEFVLDITGLLAKYTAPPSVIFGIESALFDLASQRQQIPLAQWLSPTAPGAIAVHRLLPTSVSEAVQVITGQVSETTFKFKLTGTVSESLDAVQVLVENMPTKARLRLDANQGYDQNEALQLVGMLNHPVIEFVEEPVRSPTRGVLNELLQEAVIPIALDESLAGELKPELVLNERLADILVLKPAQVGGILATRFIAAQADAAGIGIAVTSMLESGIGVLGCLHTALSLRQPALTAGLNTLDFLKSSLLQREPVVRAGHMEHIQASGLGVSLA